MKMTFVSTLVETTLLSRMLDGSILTGVYWYTRSGNHCLKRNLILVKQSSTQFSFDEALGTRLIRP